ncbi:hypothetical protein DACRYDRAFT_119709 [Dacryopinax primogenitus]|uniref:Wax synthase domain-containing protein n=1 Tax=Dacryopinax primogenitus (strain DJM 731) TaxID=1858805 RepID=M5FZF3_DACPD|nr:uncharacterized protein DACRYDRAFT_119709 [Dacryopinax primogenitus]EJT96882.1 hypothetical protein DACRYDRAFT_119709 [Dacryopinax primogenitus]
MVKQLDVLLISLHLLPELLAFAVLSSKTLCQPRSSRFVIWLTSIPIYLYLALFTSTGTPSLDYFLGQFCVVRILSLLDFLVITDARRDLWRADDHDSVKFADLGSPLARAEWAIGLLFLNPRGIGWNFEPRHALPPHPEEGRLDFVLRQAQRGVLAFLWFDLMGTIARTDTALQVGGSVLNQGLGGRAMYTVWWFTTVSSGFIVSHSMLAAFSVGLGIYQPSDWPNLFGGVKYMYTLRKFWGRGWHHNLRRFLVSTADFLTLQVLHLQPSSQLASYSQLYLAFLLSGLVHFCGSYALLRSPSLALSTLQFFALQPLVITLEDGAIALGKRLGISPGVDVRILGYTWTAACLTVMAPYWLDPLVHAGLADPGEQKSFSVVQGLWRGEWFAPVRR